MKRLGIAICMAAGTLTLIALAFPNNYHGPRTGAGHGDGPAERGGLQKGDIVLEMEGILSTIRVNFD